MIFRLPYVFNLFGFDTCLVPRYHASDVLHFLPRHGLRRDTSDGRTLGVCGGGRGLGRSGRLIGSGSTYPGTCKPPGLRVMAKNHPWGEFFLPSTVHVVDF